MQITLQIANADDNLLKAIKSVINLHPHAKLKVTKSQDITANGYSKEFEAEILQDLEFIELQRKAGTLKTYNSVNEAFKSEGLI